MKLKIGTVSKLTGFSASGIRYYEERNIISPTYGRDGTYRSFGLEDVARLLDCKNYRECGYGTDEVVAMLSSQTEQETIGHLQACQQRLHREIVRKENLEGFIRQRITALEEAASGNTSVALAESPAFYWEPLWIPGERDDLVAEIPSEECGFVIPFADSSLLLASSDLAIAAKPSERIRPSIGYGIARKFTEIAAGTPRTIFLPSRKSVYTQIEIDEDFTIPAERLAPVLSYLEQHDLVCNGRPFTHRLITQYGNASRRYDELWVPVDCA